MTKRSKDVNVRKKIFSRILLMLMIDDYIFNIYKYINDNYINKMNWCPIKPCGRKFDSA